MNDQSELARELGYPRPEPAGADRSDRRTEAAPASGPQRSRFSPLGWILLAAVVVVLAGGGVVVAYALSRGGDHPQPLAATRAAQTRAPRTAAKIEIVSLRSGDTVDVGDTVRVAVATEGLKGEYATSLEVDGEVVGEAQASSVAVVAWRPRKAGDRVVVRAVVSAQGGTPVRSKPVTGRVVGQQVATAPRSAPRAAPRSAQRAAPAAHVKAAKGLSGSVWWGAFYYASKSRGEASTMAAKGRRAGFNTLVLNTLDYDRLGRPGEEWWVVCAGKYASSAEATSAAGSLRSAGFAGAYAKRAQ